MAPNYEQRCTSGEQAGVVRHRDFSVEPLPPTEPATARMARQLEPHARLWDAAKKIIGGVVVVGAALWAGFTYGVNKAVDVRFAELKGQLDPAVLRPNVDELERRRKVGESIPPTLDDRFNTQAAKLAEINGKLDAPNNPNSEVGRKLDALDKTLQERLPRRPDKISLPRVGPTAKQEGAQ